MLKRLLSISALILFLVSSSFGAVVFDSASGDDSGAANDPNLAWTHTTAAGNNRALIIGCYDRTDSGSPPSITVDGVAATLHDSNTVGVNDGIAYLFYKLNQAVGSNSMVATFTDDATDVNACISLSFSGVHQTVPLGTAVKANNDSAASLTVDLVIATGELGVDIIGKRDISGDNTLVVGSGQTSRATRHTTSGTNIGIGMSTSPTVGTEPMNWTWATAGTTHMIAAAVKAAASVSLRQTIEVE